MYVGLKDIQQKVKKLFFVIIKLKQSITFYKTHRACRKIATGAGKTITTATLSHISESYGRSLVIVPNKSLVTQTEEDYINCGLDVGVYFGDRKELGKTHTICTWQSLNILDKKHKDGTCSIKSCRVLRRCKHYYC